MKQFTPEELARRINHLARYYKLRIVKKSGQFAVYRIMPGRAVYVGSRQSPSALLNFVKKITYSS